MYEQLRDPNLTFESLLSNLLLGFKEIESVNVQQVTSVNLEPGYDACKIILFHGSCRQLGRPVPLDPQTTHPLGRTQINEASHGQHG